MSLGPFLVLAEPLRQLSVDRTTVLSLWPTGGGWRDRHRADRLAGADRLFAVEPAGFPRPRFRAANVQQLRQHGVAATVIALFAFGDWRGRCMVAMFTTIQPAAYSLGAFICAQARRTKTAGEKSWSATVIGAARALRHC